MPMLISIVVLTALTRLLPHPPNFAPIGALALFGAAFFKRKELAILIPLLAIWVSDLILTNVVYAAYYDGFQWFGHAWVYLAFLVIALIGIFALKNWSWEKLIGTSLIGSGVFFMLTNFGSWLSPLSMFPKDLGGLISTYVAGIPFLGWTVAGDLFYALALFGIMHLAKSKFPQLAIQK